MRDVARPITAGNRIHKNKILSLPLPDACCFLLAVDCYGFCLANIVHMPAPLNHYIRWRSVQIARIPALYQKWNVLWGLRMNSQAKIRYCISVLTHRTISAWAVMSTLLCTISYGVFGTSKCRLQKRKNLVLVWQRQIKMKRQFWFTLFMYEETFDDTRRDSIKCVLRLHRILKKWSTTIRQFGFVFSLNLFLFFFTFLPLLAISINSVFCCR